MKQLMNYKSLFLILKKLPVASNRFSNKAWIIFFITGLSNIKAVVPIPTFLSEIG